MSNAVTDMEAFSIYSDRAVELLGPFNIHNNNHNSSHEAKTNIANDESTSLQIASDNSGVASSIGVLGRAHHSDSEDNDGNDEDNDNGESSSSEDGDTNAKFTPNIEINIQKPTGIPMMKQKMVIGTTSSSNSRKKNSKKKTKEQLMQQIGPPPSASITIDVQEKAASVIQLPMALLPPEEEEERNPYITDESNEPTPLNKLYDLARGLNQPISRSTTSNSNDKNMILILTLQSGKFAAAIFHKEKCIKHTTSSRYTTRKGQGGAQSSNDNAKGKANSMGSQLRRAGEVQLRQDVKSALREWSNLCRNHCALFFLSISKNLQKGFWEDANEIFGGSNHPCNLYKKSPFVVGIPLDVGKPSFEGCCAIYDLMTTCVLQTIDLQLLEQQRQQEQEEIRQEAADLEAIEEDQEEEKEQHIQKEEIAIIPLTPLHEAARDGNIEELMALLSFDDNPDDIDTRAGPEAMTPLHYAANASNDIDAASKCVHALLTQGHANPCMLDSRNRPPYFLATNENVRNAFRLARGELGEDAWRWTESAKVASALSAEDLMMKKNKAAEKKRKQRQRQKERKAKEKADKAEEELKIMEEEERKKMDEDAKRARALLKPKKGALNCDYCQKECKRKSQMFARLDYLYCSTECVKKHQRELMAAAAAARFNKN